jgi:hypothetical protein
LRRYGNTSITLPARIAALSSNRRCTTRHAAHRTPCADQHRLDFKVLIHSTGKPYVKLGAINPLKDSNKQRALVAELNTDLFNIYTDLRNNLTLHHMTASHQ